MSMGKWPGVNTCYEPAQTPCGATDSPGKKSNGQGIHTCLETTKLDADNAQILRSPGASLRLFVESSTARSDRDARKVPLSLLSGYDTSDGEDSEHLDDSASQAEQDTEDDVLAIVAQLEEERMQASLQFGSTNVMSDLPTHKRHPANPIKVDQKIQSDLSTLKAYRQSLAHHNDTLGELDLVMHILDPDDKWN